MWIRLREKVRHLPLDFFYLEATILGIDCLTTYFLAYSRRILNVCSFEGFSYAQGVEQWCIFGMQFKLHKNWVKNIWLFPGLCSTKAAKIVFLYQIMNEFGTLNTATVHGFKLHWEWPLLSLLNFRHATLLLLVELFQEQASLSSISSLAGPWVSIWLGRPCIFNVHTV